MPETLDALFELLDLNRPALASVAAARDAGGAGAGLAALREYYRSRDSVWLPAADYLGISVPADQAELDRADAALRHVFEAGPSFRQLGYKPHDYGDDIDWSHNPVNNINWVAHMHRFSWDAPLAAAYATTGDEKYAAGWCRLTDDWMRKHPFRGAWTETPADLQYNAVTRGGPPHDDRCRWAYFPLQIGARSWRWAADFELYCRGDGMDADFLARFLSFIVEHEQRTMRKTEFPPHNATVCEAIGLVRMAIVFQELKDAAAWLEKGARILADAVVEQVSEDGVQTEWSINYHIACANLFLNVVEFMRRNDVEPPAGVAEKTRRMYDCLLAAISPDRLYPMFGDPRRPAHDLVGALRRAAPVFDCPEYAAAANGDVSACPARRSYVLPHAGMYYLRSGWDSDAIYMAIHCSPPATSSHDHPDNGTFELHAFGRWIMPDSGCYAYGHGNPEADERPWFASTRVHQTLTLDNGNSVNAARHLLWRDAPMWTALAFENESYPGLVHRRGIWFVERRFFVFVDEAIGAAKGAVDLHFQLEAGEAVIDGVRKVARTARADGGNVLVWQAPNAPVRLVEEPGQVSHQFHVKGPRPAFAYRATVPNPVFVTVIAPYTGPPPMVDLVGPAAFEAGDPRLELTVTIDGDHWRLGRDLADGRAWCERMTMSSQALSQV